jgi:hypothetical protein
MKTQGVGRKIIWLFSAALLAATPIGGAADAWASMVNIDIQNGNYNSFLNDGSNTPVNYSLSSIHDASVALGTFPGGTYYDGGNDLLTPITGSLNGDLVSSAGTLTLSGIAGKLNSTLTAAGASRFGGVVGGAETVTITGGSLSSTSGGPASGSLSYTLTGALNTSGTFSFSSIQYLTATNSPNSLTSNWLYLWGDNWVINGNNRPTDGSALGLDLSGKITPALTPVPVPAAAVLFGSGLVGLVGWLRRYRNPSRTR